MTDWKVQEWVWVPGGELEDAYIRGDSIGEYVPDHAGVYLWKKKLNAPPEALESAQKFTDWLDLELKKPFGEVVNLKLSHFAALEQLTIRSPGLTDKKELTLERFTATSARRRRLAKYLRDVAQFAPPLYCGEAEDLSQRVKDHLSGDYGFGAKVQDKDVPISGWSHLDFVYYSLGMQSDKEDGKKRAKQRRTFLELITTSLSISGYVERRG